MVQGIAFLSKKSWHTKTLANQERVWKAERAQETEERRTKELARQIQQEREQDEFDKLAGKKSHIDRGINWMYQGQAASGGTDKPSELEQEDAEKRAEAYLLGKEVSGETAAHGDFTQGGAGDGVNAVVRLEDPMAMAAAASASGEPSVAERNEAFRQQMEDPMYRVGMKEREKKTEAEKQRALFERVMGPIDSDDDDDNNSQDGKKKSKQERKREKKERKERLRKEERKRKRKHHHRHRSSHSSSDDDSEEEHERRRHRQHDRRRGRDDDRKRSSKKKRRHSRSRSRSRSRSESPEPRHRNYREREWDERKSRRHYHDSGRDRRGSRREEETDRHRNQSHHHAKREEGRIKKAGFGLQGKGAEKSRHYATQDLGPAKDLLRQTEKQREEERRKTRDRASSRRTMTAEERAQALQEMQTTAEERMHRGLSKRDRDEEDEKPMQRGNAAFLKDMNEEAHGLKGGKSMAQRMRENRNTQQRTHDKSFL
ncbi:splicing factor CWC25 [Seminavis robusta]|uniref:Splicing factor CWC25 n=1 Tax=Seminavis robusta TaxID=568900 RepID=A0A9N8H8T1_9STRA|nr:splicing factor CWC25 [Seminavis robusta]|eukprot:Sro168_g074910.1 splicing factor CWC25 (486) ;mRNA; f:87285-88742